MALGKRAREKLVREANKLAIRSGSWKPVGYVSQSAHTHGGRPLVVARGGIRYTTLNKNGGDPLSDFSGHPLSIEPIVGIRAFQIDTLNRLHSTHISGQAGIWRPGENIAVHNGGTPSRRTVPTITVKATLHTDPPRDVILRDVPVPQEGEEDEHSPANCESCGFYAYFTHAEAEKNHLATSNALAAVVKGYGKVATGPLGFRAQKAQVEAIVIPGHRKQFKNKALAWLAKEDWFHLATVGVCLLALGVLSYVIGDAAGPPWLRSVGVGLAGGGSLSLLGGFTLPSRSPAAADAHLAVDVVAFQALYPDVQVYRTITEMLHHHPLSEPTVEPESDPDFWVRDVPLRSP
jgi:hypothetical protein